MQGARRQPSRENLTAESPRNSGRFTARSEIALRIRRVPLSAAKYHGLAPALL